MAAGDGAKEQPTWLQDQVEGRSCKWKVVGRVEQPDADTKIEPVGVEGKCFEIGDLASGRLGHERAGIDDGDAPGAQPFWPGGIRAPRQQHIGEFHPDISQPLQAIFECPVIEEKFPPGPDRPVAAQGPEAMVEKGSSHRGACATCAARRQGRMSLLLPRIKGAANWVVSLALPPRCPGCGTITDDLHSFCPDCWRQIDWLGESGCAACGQPLEATDVGTCAACLAKPPIIGRARAAVAYGDATRTLPLRLKYSRKVALAKTMARYMRPLIDATDHPVLVPVPLHRSRLWARGFNQSALLGRELARQCGLDHNPFALQRKKRTSALKGMSPQQRRREVAGAFAIVDDGAVQGRKVILVDDVLTTGSTAEGCARALRRAGADRIDLICWARVVRPKQFMR